MVLNGLFLKLPQAFVHSAAPTPSSVPEPSQSLQGWAGQQAATPAPGQRPQPLQAPSEVTAAPAPAPEPGPLPACPKRPCVNPSWLPREPKHGFHGNCFLLPALEMRSRSDAGCAGLEPPWNHRQRNTGGAQEPPQTDVSTALQPPGTASTHRHPWVQPGTQEPLTTQEHSLALPKHNGLHPKPRDTTDHALHRDHGVRVSP